MQMKKYVFKPYNNSFPILFEKEKERIKSQANIKLEIEHVGSTAIPNLGGKGIIDIAIAVTKHDIDAASKHLQTLGYEFRPIHSTNDRLYFVIDLPDLEEGLRRYHVHLTHPESNDWIGLIGFRDYLRTHSEAVLEYENIKKQAALKTDSEGELYRKLKRPMFEKINAIIRITRLKNKS